ncbi:hypothetical protein K440DRAFT_199371 [Wilcoxina mikolae CBS 423.85]|nr:hypothetical protein K440DRAFT_199371 [Wilcoxina mikolae CBS 423.85]
MNAMIYPSDIACFIYRFHIHTKHRDIVGHCCTSSNTGSFTVPANDPLRKRKKNIRSNVPFQTESNRPLAPRRSNRTRIPIPFARRTALPHGSQITQLPFCGRETSSNMKSNRRRQIYTVSQQAPCHMKPITLPRPRFNIHKRRASMLVCITTGHGRNYDYYIYGRMV